MRWTTDLETHIGRQLARAVCPLCGGDIRTRMINLGRGRTYLEPWCPACGMVVGKGDEDHEDI